MLKMIVTHKNPDWDAITSVWILKNFLPGFENAKVEFVQAGTVFTGSVLASAEVIEIVDGKEIIHVDTGLGPLDHHQTSDMDTCAASLAWSYVRKNNSDFKDMDNVKIEAISKIVKYVVDLDHFQEVYWFDAASDIYDFGFYGLIEGFKTKFVGEDLKCAEFGFELLDVMKHRLEQKIWAENEIKEKGVEFETRFGKSLAIESLNDEVIKLAQKMGYQILVRRDPRKGYIRIKAMPVRNLKLKTNNLALNKEDNIDLTPVYDKLKELDSKANWFLHVSKKMLLNGSSKNLDMKASKLNLQEITEIIKEAFK